MHFLSLHPGISAPMFEIEAISVFLVRRQLQADTIWNRPLRQERRRSGDLKIIGNCRTAVFKRLSDARIFPG
jgi:hypothetical protein